MGNARTDVESDCRKVSTCPAAVRPRKWTVYNTANAQVSRRTRPQLRSTRALARTGLANTDGAIPAPAASPVLRALTARVNSAVPAD